MEKNGTPASPATARASRVLPVPGGPNSSTPLGILAPMALNLAGASRNSLISCSSSTASSAPATSAKVTLGWSLETCLALDLPNCMTRLPPPCMEFKKNRNTPTMSRMGRSWMSSDTHSEPSSESTSVGTSAVLSSSVIRSADSEAKVVSNWVPSVSSPRIRELWSLISTSATRPASTRSSNSSMRSCSRSSSPPRSWLAANSTARTTTTHDTGLRSTLRTTSHSKRRERETPGYGFPAKRATKGRLRYRSPMSRP